MKRNPTSRSNTEFRIDSVRASRDGHEYHETWTARKSLQLLFPTDKLVGIAIEGLSPVDQATATRNTVQIADITLYYGQHPTFKAADRVTIVQFKHILSKKHKRFGATQAKKTIQKFAKTYIDHQKQYGVKAVKEKLQFELITNLPICPWFEQAIKDISNNNPSNGRTTADARRFATTSGLNGELLREFASKCQMTGLAGNLSDTQRNLSRTVVNWSGTSDTLARARLGELRRLIRAKAGSAGENHNLITTVDVLAALGISHEDELLPCKSQLSDIGKLVKREQFEQARFLIPRLDKPLLIHAHGGVGKTVLLDSLAQALALKHEVLFFDCFGGGMYRNLEDARHKAGRGLVHIANSLACRGLCDPLLPGSNDTEALLAAFRQRIVQCSEATLLASSHRKLILFIDAIDNAALQATVNNERAFPCLLMKMFHEKPFPKNFILVVSCRTERIEKCVEDTPYTDFRLRPFSLEETEVYLRERVHGVTLAEIRVAQARSAGNPRVLEHLATSNRGLLDLAEGEKEIALDSLLLDRVKHALIEAQTRGCNKTDTDVFLAGLSVLPPPVPIDEYASTQNMSVSAVESFAADLAPLLERTKHGLMFRDEPTETLIRERFGSDTKALNEVATNLLAQQESSVYAAAALPVLLRRLDDGDRLYNLAFDERVPATITSSTGKRKIRYSRLKAAAAYAASKRNYDVLVRLLVELSLVTSVDQKGTYYLAQCPDLVVAANDVDATRRLFEMSTSWPGARHARLAILHTLLGDREEALRHAIRCEQWIDEYHQRSDRRDYSDGRPERLDMAAIPFFLIAQDSPHKAVQHLRQWKHWYSYEVCGELFRLLPQLLHKNDEQGNKVTEFLKRLTSDIGVMASVFTFSRPEPEQRIALIGKLANACDKAGSIEINEFSYAEQRVSLQDGFLDAAISGLSLDLHSQALSILRRAPIKRQGLWTFLDHFWNKRVYQFLAHAALLAAASKRPLIPKDILPEELVALSPSDGGLSATDLNTELKKKLAEHCRLKSHDSKTTRGFSDNEKRYAEKFIDRRLVRILNLTRAFSVLASSPVGRANKNFRTFLDRWRECASENVYEYPHQDRFFHLLGLHLAELVLRNREDLSAASVKAFIVLANSLNVCTASNLIGIVKALAKSRRFQLIAGELARNAERLILENHDIAAKGQLYVELSAAILPASTFESVAYFRAGLEQLDAIGSGDYEFVNELLLLASSLHGDEIADEECHTLANICDLNFPDEAAKFPWWSFAKGTARACGFRVLEQLARWDDQSKATLTYTLLPYLTALVQEKKIAAEDAIALNILARPVQHFDCGTADFAHVVSEKSADPKDCLSELFRQIIFGDQASATHSVLASLRSLAKRVLGGRNAITRYLTDWQRQSDFTSPVCAQTIGSSLNAIQPHWGNKNVSRRKRLKELERAVSATDPKNSESLQRAVDDLKRLGFTWPDVSAYFDRLRSRVAYSNRDQFVQNLSGLENLNFFTKLEQLRKCKSHWKKSSSSIESTLNAVATRIVRLHCQDFVSFSRLSIRNITTVTECCGCTRQDLILELIEVFCAPEFGVAAPVWLGLASLLCGDAAQGVGQIAITRLLTSDATKLAASSGILDSSGNSRTHKDFPDYAAGLIWRMLGSPYASDRWRAAHSIRCFARFNRWTVIDRIADRFSKTNAGVFQAPDLPFYFMHARLWLIIALARIARDYPDTAARYKTLFASVLQGEDCNHIVMRHFASEALQIGVRTRLIEPRNGMHEILESVNTSPFPVKVLETFKRGHGPYDEIPPRRRRESKREFYLDYDFQKYEVATLASVFGMPGWDVGDRIKSAVHRLAPKARSMYEDGGRGREYEAHYKMHPDYHRYGEYLGWHGIRIVAGELLRTRSVVQSEQACYDWNEWLERVLLTRADGLWLADGLDYPPIDLMFNLLEESDKGSALTGKKNTLLRLIGILRSQVQDLTVCGHWRSPDGIDVSIRSVFAPVERSKARVRRLLDEAPYFAWLPTYDFYDGNTNHECSNHGDSLHAPWLFTPSTEGRLDVDDPLGGISAEMRPRFSKEIMLAYGLELGDPFGRTIRYARGKVVACAEAWKSSREARLRDWEYRLACKGPFLKRVLCDKRSDLLLLIKLERYVENRSTSDGTFLNTIAVVLVSSSLEFTYYPGAVNVANEPKWR